MNIYLIQVSDHLGGNKFLPLATGYVWCYAKNDRWDLKDVLIEKIPPAEYVSTMEDPKLVTMSSYMWNWEYNRSLAREIKAKYPDCIIATGGPQIDKYDPDWFVDKPEFDLAIHGEGEFALKEILLRPIGDYDQIPHVQTRTHRPAGAQRIRDISTIPSPILEGFYEPLLKKYPADTQWNLTIETLRGCPYHCSFCDIGEDYYNKLTLFDIERVKKEIDWIGKNKIEYVNVCDSNWGLLDRDVEITKYVLDTKRKYGYPKFWDVTWAKNNVERNYEIALLNAKEADEGVFKGVTFAMQSMNESTLQATKRFNMDDEKVAEYLKKYHKEKIPTYGELIWPMPQETLDSFKDNVQKIIDLGQDSYMQIHPLMITENTDMGKPEYQKKWGMELVRAPLENKFVKIDKTNYITEYTQYVKSTNTATWEDVISGYMFKWIVLTMFYNGWMHHIAKYLKSALGVKETEMLDDLQKWILQNPDTLIYKEYKVTEQHHVDTYEKGDLWGRTILGDDDIRWDYAGASSIVFHENNDTFEEELIKFVEDTYNLEQAKEIVKLNLHSCKSKHTQYPVKVYATKEVARHMFGLDKNVITFKHWDKDDPTSDSQWFQRAYHRYRKLKYWHVFAS